MSQGDDFDQVILALNEAAMDESCWPRAAVLIDNACGTKGSCLIFGQGKAQRDVFFWTKNFYLAGERRTDFEADYFDGYYQADERVPRIKTLPDGKLVHVSELYTDQERNSSPVYNEFLPRTYTQDSLITHLEGPGLSQIVWSIADPVESTGWRTDQVEMMQRLLPHLRHCVSLRQALADVEAVGWSLYELLDNKNCGIIQLDRHGRILEMNDSASALLSRRTGLAARGGFLTVRDTSDNSRLQEVLHEALPRLARPATSGSVTIARAPAGSRLVLHVFPVEQSRTDFRTRRVAAIVMIVDPEANERIDPQLVGEAFGLTRTESVLAVSLASGLTIRDIAVSTGREESTIRWHMKKIFKKQGISRQAQLVQRVQTLKGIPR